MVQLMNPEWRDYIDENTTLVIDLDSPCFAAASLNEENVMTVIHKASGKEVFKHKQVDEFVKECVNPETLEEGYSGNDKPRYSDKPTGKKINVKFKNKTDFWGRTKKKVTGWLGDLNEKRIAEDKEPFEREDFEITFEKKAGEVAYAISHLKKSVQQIKDYLGIQKAICLIGEGNNHRHDVLLPTNPNKPDEPLTGRYKGQRPSNKPVLLEEVRKYAVNYLNAIDVTGNNVEVDDVFNFYMHKSHVNYKRTGKHLYVGVAQDKDALSFNGLIFNYYKDGKDKKWKHPYPYLVDGLGELDLKDGEVKGKGVKWLCTQCLMGDQADNFYPTRHAGIAFGNVDAYKYLHDCDTPKEVIQKTYDKYLEWFPEGTEFTAWNGEQVKVSALEWLEMIFTCAYMLKGYKDTTTFKDLMDYVGVEYDDKK
tara:strand:+ start:8724 stop:9989 length:1266 start_codon:yes stop_codon:yes gene_type:complete